MEAVAEEPKPADPPVPYCSRSGVHVGPSGAAGAEPKPADPTVSYCSRSGVQVGPSGAAVDSDKDESSSDEEVELSENTIRRNEIRNELARLFGDLEEMTPELVPNATMRAEIERLTSRRVEELRQELNDIIAREEPEAVESQEAEEENVHEVVAAPEASDDREESEENEVSQDSNGSRASALLWERVYDTERKGTEMWLSTYVGDAAGGFMLDIDADRVCEWDRRGRIDDTTLTSLPYRKTLWWMHCANPAYPDLVRLFDEEMSTCASITPARSPRSGTTGI